MRVTVLLIIAFAGGITSFMQEAVSQSETIFSESASGNTWDAIQQEPAESLLQSPDTMIPESEVNQAWDDAQKEMDKGWEHPTKDTPGNEMNADADPTEDSEIDSYGVSRGSDMSSQATEPSQSDDTETKPEPIEEEAVKPSSETAKTTEERKTDSDFNNIFRAKKPSVSAADHEKEAIHQANLIGAHLSPSAHKAHSPSKYEKYADEVTKVKTRPMKPVSSQESITRQEVARIKRDAERDTSQMLKKFDSPDLSDDEDETGPTPLKDMKPEEKAVQNVQQNVQPTETMDELGASITYSTSVNAQKKQEAKDTSVVGSIMKDLGSFVKLPKKEKHYEGAGEKLVNELMKTTNKIEPTRDDAAAWKKNPPPAEPVKSGSKKWIPKGLVHVAGTSPQQPENVEWMKMHLAWVKAKEYAKSYADAKKARRQCLKFNLEGQVKCGAAYCKAGESKKCGGLCEKGAHIYLTPLNKANYYQATELEVKVQEKKKWMEKHNARLKEINQKSEAVINTTKTLQKKVLLVTHRIVKEDDEKEAFKAKLIKKENKAKASAKAFNTTISTLKDTEYEKLAAKKVKQTKLKMGACKAKSKKKKKKCVAVKNAQDKKDAAVNATYSSSGSEAKEEEKAQQDAVKKGKEALKKEVKKKAKAKKEAAKEIAAKVKIALPPGVPKGKFKWDFSKPCDAGAGTFKQDVALRKKIDVGTIPKGKYQVRVELKSPVDVDIELWDATTGEAIIAFMEGKIDSATQASVMHYGNKIEYSGYNGDQQGGYGDEWITIEGTAQHPYIIKAYGFSEGAAAITYSWTGIQDCKNPGLPPVVMPTEAETQAAENVTNSGVQDGNATDVAFVQMRIRQRLLSNDDAEYSFQLEQQEAGNNSSGTQASPAQEAAYSSSVGPDTAPEDMKLPKGGMCAIEAEMVLSECLTAAEETLDEQFKAAYETSNAKLANKIKKENSSKQLAAAQMKQKATTFNITSTAELAKLRKLNKKLNKKYITYKSSNKAEIAQKRKAHKKHTQEEKAHKKLGPERDTKERSKKNQPRCKHIAEKAERPCHKAVDSGFKKCQEAFNKVPKAKDLVRAYSYSEGKAGVINFKK